jgi:hypothetical protein
MIGAPGRWSWRAVLVLKRPHAARRNRRGLPTMVLLLTTLIATALLMWLVFQLVHPHVDALWGELPAAADASDPDSLEPLSSFGV